MQPFSVDSFLANLSQAEGVDVKHLAPLVKEVCDDMEDIALTEPHEFVRLGMSQQEAELLVSRAESCKFPPFRCITRLLSTSAS